MAPSSAGRLAGQRALVTGGANGIGAAIVRRLAAEGAAVVLVDRDAQAAQALADEVGATAVVLDVTDLPALQAAVLAQGPLQILVNNAGVDQHAPFHRIGLEEFRAIFETNFFGTLQFTHAAWKPMRDAGHGRILVSTSSAGLHGLHGLSAYAASKAALIGLARTLAAEGASRDVFCNAIAPYAATRMTDAHLGDAAREAMAPEHVAPLVAALVDADSRVNGEVIVVGLGWARRATTVELASGSPGDVYAVQEGHSATGPARVAAPNICSEFPDALQAFDDFQRVARLGLAGRNDAG